MYSKLLIRESPLGQHPWKRTWGWLKPGVPVHWASACPVAVSASSHGLFLQFQVLLMSAPMLTNSLLSKLIYIPLIHRLLTPLGPVC